MEHQPYTEKPRLGFWEIWNMSIGFMGIQFGFALQNANTSRIFATLGADTDNLALYWLAAPLTGLIVQPIVGYLSDRTWHPYWGRRRPYFALGALLTTLSLCLMPNSPTLWFAIGMLWIMDASINISMEPFRAFVGDLLPLDQRTFGFTMQSFFIGTGAIVASFLPWIFEHFFNVSNAIEQPNTITDTVKYSYYLGAFMLLITVFWTVFSTKEHPSLTEKTESPIQKVREKIPDGDFFAKKSKHYAFSLFFLALIVFALVYSLNLEKEMYVLSLGLFLFASAHGFASLYIRMGKSNLGIVHIVHDLHTMPSTMKQLAFVQFFSWFALFAMWIYTTPAVTSHIFHSTDPTSQAYNEGATLVGNLFGIYNGIAAIAALLLTLLAIRMGKKYTHGLALFCGGLGLVSFYFVSNPTWLWLSMTAVGIAWASILSIPYALLANALPPKKMGYYMGVFNFFIVIPQIVAGTLLGFMLKGLFDGQPIFVLVAGGLSMMVAASLCLRINETGHAQPYAQG